jgi:hypothetical protein
MSLHVGGFGFWSPFQPPLNLRSISGTSARNRGDAKGLTGISGDFARLPVAAELRSPATNMPAHTGGRTPRRGIGRDRLSVRRSVVWTIRQNTAIGPMSARIKSSHAETRSAAANTARPPQSRRGSSISVGGPCPPPFRSHAWPCSGTPVIRGQAAPEAWVAAVHWEAWVAAEVAAVEVLAEPVEGSRAVCANARTLPRPAQTATRRALLSPLTSPVSS